MKKLISLMLVCFMFATMLVGCSTPSEPQSEQTTDTEQTTSEQTQETSQDASDLGEKPEKLVVIVTPELADLMNAAADVFYEEYEIDVEIIPTAYESMHDKTVTMVNGGSQLDIVNVDGVWAAEYAKGGITIGLKEYFTEDELSLLYDSFVQSMYVEDDIYVLPFQTDSKWLYYNEAMLAEAGYDAPPTTWDELIEMSNSMMEQGIAKTGLGWAGTQAEGLVCEFTALMTAAGGSWQNDSGEWDFNTEAGLFALNTLIDTMASGVADPASVTFNDRTVLDPFMAGDMAFVPNWSYAYNLTRNPDESAIAEHVGITLMPGTDGVTSGSVTGGGGMGITTSCTSPAYAAELLKLTVSMQIQERALSELGYMPILKSVLEDPELLEASPHFAVMAEQYQYAGSRPSVTNYSEWSLEMQGYLSQALVGDTTPEEALQIMQDMSVEKYS